MRKYMRLLLMPLALTLSFSVAVAAEGSAERLFEDFDWRLEQQSVTNLVTHTPEARAILDQGVAVLPRLIELFREMEGERPFVMSNYAAIIQLISGVARYSYSPEPKKVGLMDFYDADLESLPSFSSNVTEFHARDYRAEFLEYWDEIVGLHDPSERITTMHSITRDIDPMAENLTGTRWREYERAMGSLGIFNLPVYIEQVKEHDDPVAFAEFLRVTSHPFYWQSGFKAIHVHIERVREAANAFPEHEERVELVHDWWERSSDQFLAFPALRSAIESRLHAGAQE